MEFLLAFTNSIDTSKAVTPLRKPSSWEIFWDGDAAWWVYLIVVSSIVAIIATAIALYMVHRHHMTAQYRVSVDDKEYTLKWHEEFTPPIPKRTGYAFRGWYIDSACTVPWDSRKYINRNTVLFTKWEKE